MTISSKAKKSSAVDCFVISGITKTEGIIVIKKKVDKNAALLFFIKFEFMINTPRDTKENMSGYTILNIHVKSILKKL
jgi:hypothetical protein